VLNKLKSEHLNGVWVRVGTRLEWQIKVDSTRDDKQQVLFD